MSNRPKPYTLSGDPTAETVERINEMFDTIYQDTGVPLTHSLLSQTHPDTTPASPVAGDIISGVADSGVTTWRRQAIGAANTILRTNGDVPVWGKADLTSDVANVLPVPNGGTGISSYTIGDLIYATGAAILSKLADVATGNALISGGIAAAPSWGKIGLTTHVTGTLPIANGGTGQTAATAAFNALSPLTTRGDLVTRDASNNIRLAIGVAHRVLKSDGVDPSWGTLEDVGYWSPMTNGNPTSPELLFDSNGDVIMAWTNL